MKQLFLEKKQNKSKYLRNCDKFYIFQIKLERIMVFLKFEIFSDFRLNIGPNYQKYQQIKMNQLFHVKKRCK
jgi:hypothetical protein